MLAEMEAKALIDRVAKDALTDTVADDWLANRSGASDTKQTLGNVKA